jgi:hypothetical protein
MYAYSDLGPRGNIYGIIKREEYVKHVNLMVI